MKVLLLTTGGGSDEIRYLKSRGISARTASADEVPPLDGLTTQQVYVISAKLLEDASWPEIRVTLAESNRCFIVIQALADSGFLVRAIKDGAYDVCFEGDSPERYQGALQAALNAQTLWLQLYGQVGKGPRPLLVGESESIRNLRHVIERIAPTDATVLILGESGSGKEMVARSIHGMTSSRPFVAVNCAAFPSELMEAELFGSAKGAYTGALSQRAGLVREAEGGTLFLDEIGELGLQLQPKLLRFLETRRTRAVGDTKEYSSSARIITATNRDLYSQSLAGKFRSDLYYRLAEITLTVPPLRERLGDIPFLADEILHHASIRFGKNFDGIDSVLLEKWKQYHWPGNVRELKHVIDRMALFYDGPVLRADWWNLPSSEASSSPANTDAMMTGEPTETNSPVPATNIILDRQGKLKEARRLLAEGAHDLAWVAAHLGIHPSTLYRWRIRKRC